LILLMKDVGPRWGMVANPPEEVGTMDLNEYVLETLVQTTLDDARAHAARQRLIGRARPTSLRARLGLTLIATGRWLVAQGGQRLPAAEASRA
jgi:hypothetical protein